MRLNISTSTKEFITNGLRNVRELAPTRFLKIKPNLSYIERDEKNEVIEYFDIWGRIKGTMLRKEVHEQLLIHRGAFVFGFDKDSIGEERILLARRAAKKKAFPNYWSSTAEGHVSVKESTFDAAKNELEEELGVENKRIVWMFTSLHLPEEPLVYDVFITFLNKNEEYNLKEDEVSEVRWFTRQEVFDLIRGALIHPVTKELQLATPWFKQAYSEYASPTAQTLAIAYNGAYNVCEKLDQKGSNLVTFLSGLKIKSLEFFKKSKSEL